LKLVEAAARGVPIVCTTDLAKQLGWAPGTDLLAGDRPEELAESIASLYADAALWNRLRGSALARVAAEYSPAMFESQLRAALEDVALTRGVLVTNVRSDFS
jgi:glycosyltransferase involved in cell wall biosynthesis